MTGLLRNVALHLPKALCCAQENTAPAKFMSNVAKSQVSSDCVCAPNGTDATEDAVDPGSTAGLKEVGKMKGFQTGGVADSCTALGMTPVAPAVMMPVSIVDCPSSVVNIRSEGWGGCEYVSHAAPNVFFRGCQGEAGPVERMPAPVTPALPAMSRNQTLSQAPASHSALSYRSNQNGLRLPIT